MSKSQAPEPLSSDHSIVRLTNVRSERLSGFERPGRRVGGALGASVVTHVAGVTLFLLALQYAPPQEPAATFELEDLSDKIIWLAAPGPGGGGGGGGNRTPEPPRAAELPGKEAITVPVEKPPEFENPLTKPDESEPPPLNIPARTLASNTLDTSFLPGAIQSSGPLLSLGTGIGGGAGTGTGTGIGPGRGSGLGEGFGGGTGGGVYRPGNGVESPRLLRKVDPQYTTDAMRAKVQGIVEIECVVETTGVCSRISVVRGLDSRFGLDGEAIKAVQQWRFVPGRLKGQEVPVQITIELTFTLR